MLEDIRLTPVNVMARYKKWCEDDELHGSDTFAEYIANTATDMAIKKIVEYLELIVTHNDDGWAIIPSFSREMEALRKLVKED